MHRPTPGKRSDLAAYSVGVAVGDPATGRPEAAVSGGHMLRWPFGLRCVVG